MTTRYFVKYVLWLFCAAAVLLVVAGWRYADQTSFARRSVVTTGTVADVIRSGVFYQDDGPAITDYSGRVHYQVKGADVLSNRLKLVSCSLPSCPVPTAGQTVTVAYDTHNFNRAVRSGPGGLPHWPMPNVIVLVCGVLGLAFLAAVAINVAWIWPVLRTRPRRGA
ncbi:DUF3592 domain-containing protein [Herbidospora daliensis]|uniref:DUF3592 domain-containing protein n=1 Tax=Herbidospora daliensis TaxID=295585 RepID=UPI0007835765|nr:DUF3592 domain-containing protein [Herbidospora daliensis]